MLFEAFATRCGAAAAARGWSWSAAASARRSCAGSRPTSGIDEHVLFTGVRATCPPLLPGFDVSCLSSVHEGVPMAVIESMAAGLPVVATDCGALRDMVDDGEHGYLVPVGDAEALADRLLAAGRRPGAARSAGAARPVRGRAAGTGSSRRRAATSELLVDLVGADEPARTDPGGEPVRPVRPSGVAGEPRAGRRRLRGHGDLPDGDRRDRSRR